MLSCLRLCRCSVLVDWIYGAEEIKWPAVYENGLPKGYLHQELRNEMEETRKGRDGRAAYRRIWRKMVLVYRPTDKKS